MLGIDRQRPFSGPNGCSSDDHLSLARIKILLVILYPRSENGDVAQEEGHMSTTVLREVPFRDDSPAGPFITCTCWSEFQASADRLVDYLADRFHTSCPR
jgi:hypothetical protein